MFNRRFRFDLAGNRFKIFLFAGLHLIPVCRVITGMAGVVGLDFHDLPLLAVNFNESSHVASLMLKKGAAMFQAAPCLKINPP